MWVGVRPELPAADALGKRRAAFLTSSGDTSRISVYCGVMRCPSKSCVPSVMQVAEGVGTLGLHKLQDCLHELLLSQGLSFRGKGHLLEYTELLCGG